MESTPKSRYEQVSRRALLKATVGAGTLVLVPGLACATSDSVILAGALTDPVATTTTPPDALATIVPAPTLEPVRAPEDTGADALSTELPADTTVDPTATAAPEAPDAFPTATAPAATAAPTATPIDAFAVAAGAEMVIEFTYTQAPGGKNERPYIAVWIEDAQGDLTSTVALWYQQERRGERWLDHLSRWYDLDLDRIAAGAASDAATISSATRNAGSYAVSWDGAADGQALPPGDYFVCIEAAREDGPYSLIRHAARLDGSVLDLRMPDEGELSSASARINV